MRYKIEVTKHFEKDFRKLSPEVMRRIRDKILELKVNPHIHKLLTGQLYGLRSMRVREYRVLYVIDEINKKSNLSSCSS
jgi:addiction module RelE/StbE family toxin